MAQRSREQLAEIAGVRVLDRGTDLCGIVTVHHPRWEPKTLLAHLGQRNINVRVSPLHVAQFDFPKKGVEWALRISPHYYNTGAEIDQAIEAIRQFVTPAGPR